MTFGVDDYEKSIVRIFDRNENVIGTGFLVAPGYVLTCAHVVLQVIGIKKENFANYEGQPNNQISLDFPVIDTDEKVIAEVVCWLPYRPEKDDIAALKLLSSAPNGVRPIPLTEVKCADVGQDNHLVYGFGRPTGGRSDAYRPKAHVAGGRFQLCKFGDPNDETIQPGFSGAPLWNDVINCAIGMVVTAKQISDKDTEYHAAYAIPTPVLQPILKQIEAFCLHDVLIQSIDSCADDNDRHQLNLAISTALRYCNPNGGDRSWQNQLLDLSTDRAPAPGWEAEGRLVQFAMMLVKMDDISLNTYDALQDWVNNLCHFDFLALLDRITREMKQQKISSSNVCQHLMVVVEQKETSIDKLRVSMWAVEDRNTYDPYKPPSPTIPEKILTIAELPDFIRQQIRQKFRKSSTPTIHLFLPRALFGCDIEMQHCGKAGAALGSEYPFVVRTNLKTHPISYYYYDDWNEKWEKIVTAGDVKTDLFFTTVDCSMPETNLIEDLALINAAMLQNWDSVGELFGMIAEETALPVAIWSRDTQFQDNLSDVLDGIVEKLRYRIQRERNKAHRSPSKPLLGHHLSLIWEDPKIVPPDMQFDPRVSAR